MTGKRPKRRSANICGRPGCHDPKSAHTVPHPGTTGLMMCSACDVCGAFEP